MLSKSQRDELRQSIKYSMEVHGEYYESPIENSTLGELLDAADELARLREGLNGLLAQMERAESELEHPGRYAAARCISGRDVKALLNHGGDDATR